jgi:glutaredoxin
MWRVDTVHHELGHLAGHCSGDCVAESKAGSCCITLYTKPGCHLCDDAKAVLQELRERLDFELLEIDITTDPVLDEAFRDEIPVGYVDGRKLFKYRVDPVLLQRQLHRRGRWLAERWFSLLEG